MIEETFLGGKVRKWVLPLVQGRPGPETPTLKRLLLPQGELAQFYDADEGIRYMASLELCADAVRANHFHKVKEEWLYVIRGELLLIAVDPPSGTRATVPLRAGELAFIGTGIAHALRTVAPGQAIEFSPTRFQPADAYPFALA